MSPEDVIALQQLMALYGHLADAAKFEPVDSEPQRRLDQIFTDDAVFDATGAGAAQPWRGLDEIRAMFSQPKPRHTPSHMTTNVVVWEDGGDTARVKSKFLAGRWGGAGVRYGSYDDVVVRCNGGWRIRHRVCVIHDDGE
jgi:SnoaL-like domain